MRLQPQGRHKSFFLYISDVAIQARRGGTQQATQKTRHLPRASRLTSPARAITDEAPLFSLPPPTSSPSASIFARGPAAPADLLRPRRFRVPPRPQEALPADVMRELRGSWTTHCACHSRPHLACRFCSRRGFQNTQSPTAPLCIQRLPPALQSNRRQHTPSQHNLASHTNSYNCCNASTPPSLKTTLKPPHTDLLSADAERHVTQAPLRAPP